MDLDEGWSHVFRGRRVVKASTATSKPFTQPVTEAPKQPRVTATTKKAKPGKADPKITAAPKAASVKPKKAASTGAKPVAASPPLANSHPTTSPLEGISVLIDKLPINACLELTRRVFISIPSLPKGAVRSLVVLIAVILFVAEFCSTPLKDGSG
jgi:hypothetical protein